MPTRFTRMSGWVAAALATVCTEAFAAAPNWTFDAYVRVPYRNTLFLAQDNQGNLYATTFNNAPNADTVRAFKISEPAGVSPQVTEIDQAQVPTFRGYSGIAVDAGGTVFLSVDSGDSGQSYIKKLLPNGKPDSSFGTNGAVTQPGTRFQGLAVAGEKLVAAVSWGRIEVLDAATGKVLSESPAQPSSASPITIRDITIIPATQEILGIDRDTVHLFTGGTFENASAYTLNPLIKGSGRQTAGQAIYYHAPSDRIYYTRTGLGHMGSADKSNAVAEVIQTVGTNPGGPLADPADAVISADGKYLFVSDLRGPAILRYRSAGSTSMELASASTPAPSSTAMEVTSTEVAASVPAPPGQSIVTSNTILPVPAPAQALASAPSIPALNGTPLQSAGGAVDGPPRGGSVSPSPTAGATLPSPASAVSPKVESDSTPAKSAAERWESGDLRRALSKAFSEKRRLVAFFTDTDVPVAQRIETEVFESPGFYSKFPDALWLRLTLGVDRADVERYGVFRVPTIIIFSPNGDEARRLSGAFTLEEFEKAYAESGQSNHPNR